MNSLRRQFLGSTVALAGGLVIPAAWAQSAPSGVAQDVQVLFDSLSTEQRQVVQLEYANEGRQRVDANFDITTPSIGSSFYSEQQRRQLEKILRSMFSEAGYRRFMLQMREDAGGVSGYYMAFFERRPSKLEAGRPEVEWMLTGRHMTLRASTRRGSLVGGVRVYGHGQSEPRRSLYFRQMQLANALYQSMSPSVRHRVLKADAPFEEDVTVGASLPSGSDFRLNQLSPNSRVSLRRLVDSLTRLFEPDFAGLLKQRMLNASALAKSSVVFYREDDVYEDGQWDVWRLQGPGYTWHYRGAPHVHAYLNLA